MNKYVTLIIILFAYTVFIGLVVSDCAIGTMAGSDRPLLINTATQTIKEFFEAHKVYFQLPLQQ